MAQGVPYYQHTGCIISAGVLMVMAPVLLVYQLTVPEVLVVVEVLVPAPVDLGQQGVVVSHQTRYTVHGASTTPQW